MRVSAGRAVSGGLFALLTMSVGATASGLSGLHQHVQVGDKICMVGHFHYGQTAGWRSKGEAMQSAARSWAWFTGLEYGDAWADYRLAIQQTMDCQESASERGGTVWSCKSKAVPCRPLTPAAAERPIMAEPAHRQPHALPPRPHHAAPVVLPQAVYVPRGPVAPHWNFRHAPQAPHHMNGDFCPSKGRRHVHHGHRPHHGFGYHRPQIWPGDAR